MSVASPEGALGPPLVDRASVAPPEHARAFRLRRFANWFPLGLTYATFYMGRYNFNVAKGQLGATFHLDKAQVGIVATAGFWTYALSVIVNGPLADRFGGRRAILAAAVGAAAINAAVALLFLGGFTAKLVLTMSLLWSVNMYFQSFAALSVVKVNAAWFHVRERGILGGVFGSMISLGYWLAMTVGGWILASMPFWAVFAIPSAAILALFFVDLRLVRDSPSAAGHRDFATGDASTGDESPPNLAYVLKNVFGHPVLRTLAAAEFCTGFVRQGLLLYFTEFLAEVHHAKPGGAVHAWTGVGITIGGIAGSLVCGWLSDRFFSSRRPPVAFLFYLAQVVAVLLVGWAPTARTAAAAIGFSCMWIFGVHGMLSGTASMDFGGRKAAATAAGMLDGIQYVASGLTGFGLGFLLDRYGWHVWTYTLLPFSIAGALLMLPIWNARPTPRAAH